MKRERTVLDLLPLVLDLAGEFPDAELVDQDLDARLVDVVAATILVVDAQDRFDVAQDVAA